MKHIKISDTKDFREHLGATHLVLFAVAPDGTQHVSTHGETEQNAKEAAEAGNNLKRALGWDGVLCKAAPLERRCRNCTYYEGWGIQGNSGFCQLEPTNIKVDAEQKCRHFEPRG